MAGEMHDTGTQEEWIPTDTFGARLALVRNKLGMNQAEAAFLCGIPKQSWRRWELGQRPHDERAVARKIADGTGVDYRWLREGGPMSIGCYTHLASNAPTPLPFLTVVQ